MIGFENCVLCGSPIRDRCGCDRALALRRLHGHLCGAVLHLEEARRIADAVPIVDAVDRAFRSALAGLENAVPDYGRAAELGLKAEGGR